MNDKEWEKFLEWVYKAHQIIHDWTPNRTSIEVWEEYRKKK